MFIVIAGAVVLFGGLLVLTLAITAIVRLIQKEYKLNKAIKEMDGEDPYIALYESDNLYACVDREHLKEIIAREELARRERGILERVKDFFSNDKKESSKLVKEIYDVKKQAIKEDNKNPEIGVLEKTVNRAHLSKAKTAYLILKSQRGREQYQKSLNAKSLRVAEHKTGETAGNKNSNTSKNKRTNGYEFEVKTNGFQRFLMLFKTTRQKQYQPSGLFKKHSNQAESGGNQYGR
ncbi:MAG: hypothetical protein SFW07_04845 [Gammaproteobacteria bacterium]|nr:hypothetical protein [Gammaproteobacteria bacterium]